MLSIILSTVIYASPVNGEVFFAGSGHSAIYGKPSTPTPIGTFKVQRVYSSHLKTNVIMFHRNEHGIYAIHVNLKSRNTQLNTATPVDNHLSNGCIGVSEQLFTKLWNDRSLSTIVISQ